MGGAIPPLIGLLSSFVQGASQAPERKRQLQAQEVERQKEALGLKEDLEQHEAAQQVVAAHPEWSAEEKLQFMGDRSGWFTRHIEQQRAKQLGDAIMQYAQTITEPQLRVRVEALGRFTGIAGPDAAFKMAQQMDPSKQLAAFYKNVQMRQSIEQGSAKLRGMEEKNKLARQQEEIYDLIIPMVQKKLKERDFAGAATLLNSVKSSYVPSEPEPSLEAADPLPETGSE